MAYEKGKEEKIMAGLKKKGPHAKSKKRKGKYASLPKSFIPRGKAAKARRAVLPI